MRAYKELSQKYNINTKALKRELINSGYKPKQATPLQVLEVIYINAPILMYCRADETEGTVEYLDTDLFIKLIYDLREYREVA
ncbi:MAG: hypothetical protein Q9M40_12660 [Sulfurimonas sp.]|nr:hypothetical protein [Sulfurimonas sp.]